jgi:diadenosine tetraphosphatase ApaH/serine/threonine PP2A family protein phosphatase
MTRDEQRQAWRTYAAAILSTDAYEYRDTGLPAVAKLADEMLTEERKRFDTPAHVGDTTTPAEPRPWVRLTGAERYDIVLRWSGDPMGCLDLADEMLRAKNGGTR